MEFAVIAPTTLLDTWSLTRPIQFCLAHLCNRTEYFTWYQNRVANGKTVILDNGAYEGELMDFDELARIAHELQPTVVVLPDVIGNAKLTTYLHNAFRSYFRSNSYAGGDEYKPEFMAVLQGKDIWELIEQYQRVPEKWIGFPRQMGIDAAVSRGELARKLKKIDLWRPSVKHHALGMADGSLPELKSLAVEGFHSCDSSNPVWRVISDNRPFDVDWKGYPQRNVINDRLGSVLAACKGEK